MPLFVLTLGDLLVNEKLQRRVDADGLDTVPLDVPLIIVARRAHHLDAPA